MRPWTVLCIFELAMVYAVLVSMRAFWFVNTVIPLLTMQFRDYDLVREVKVGTSGDRTGEKGWDIGADNKPTWRLHDYVPSEQPI